MENYTNLKYNNYTPQKNDIKKVQENAQQETNMS